VVAGACLAYGAFIERNAFRLEKHMLPILPAGSAPIKVLHLSDIHLLPGDRAKIAFIRSLGELKPDFIVNTGDNLATGAALGALARAFEPLAGVPGVFVLGSNDFFAPAWRNPARYFLPRRPARGGDRLPTGELLGFLEDCGWTNTEDKELGFDLLGTRIIVRGCGDAHLGWEDYESVAGPVPAETDLFIAVTHAPYRSVLDLMTADGADLIFAGHTHGGQVCLPGGHALTTNCDLPTCQARGLSQWNHGDRWSHLHVSAGLGTSPYAPYRFACPPEATLIPLQARD
jgi:predicted MPP superfamily phosphohydrolase